jgi:hypothetical protein
MTSTKYTEEEVKQLTSMYADKIDIEKISISLNRSERSVRAKLSALGLYSKKPYLNKNGQPPKKKEDYVREICVYLDISEDMADSLEKCTKFILERILTKLKAAD